MSEIRFIPRNNFVGKKKLNRMLPACRPDIVDMSATDTNVCPLGGVADRHTSRHYQPSPSSFSSSSSTPQPPPPPPPSPSLPPPPPPPPPPLLRHLLLLVVVYCCVLSVPIKNKENCNVLCGAIRGVSWMQGLAVREEDVDKDQAVAIAVNVLKEAPISHCCRWICNHRGKFLVLS